MLDVKSYVNDLEIIYSGQAHLVQDNILKINFDDVYVEVKFVADSQVSAGQINWVVEEGVLKITFVNYNSTVGSGIFHPWLIGDFQGKELYITFYSKWIEFNPFNYFICNYIFYTGKEVVNV